MSSNVDIKTKTQPATEGAVCRNESENQTAHGLAGDYADLVEPDTEPDYEVEGLIPHN